MTFGYIETSSETSSVTEGPFEGEVLSVGPSLRDLALSGLFNGFFTALFLCLLWLVAR